MLIHILGTLNDNNELVALDFGCMKQIPTDFTRLILNWLTKKVINDPKIFNAKLFELEIRTDDSKKK
jgi:predicted unusual protein kinase regulating ubiquinone biosynthesis (AarF/ABC1/UbiB family)